MAIPFNSGTVQAGSQILTINSKAYPATSIQGTHSTWEVDRQDQLGVVDGFYVGKDKFTGSAELTYGSAVSSPPDSGDTFSIVFPSGTITAVVLNVTESEGNRELKKCSITWREDMND